MNQKELLEAAIGLQDLLVARATGGAGSAIDYRDLRELFMSSPELHDLLPRFVRTSRTIDQFWSYIKRESGGYQDRREYIWGAFDPLLRYLEGDPVAAQPPAPDPPRRGPSPDATPGRDTRAFISYSTVDKLAAAAVKSALSTVGIACFMAHDDIQVAEEWRERILEELAACDLFIPLLSSAFKSSDWAPQELGAIAMRPDVAVVPLSLDGTVPFGFAAKIQGAKVPTTGVDPESILEPLAKRYPRIAFPALIRRVRDARTFRIGEATMRPLVPYFAALTAGELHALVSASMQNNQVWDATLCRTEYLPQLLEVRRADISPADLSALRHLLNDE